MQATRQQILDYLRLHRDAGVKDLGKLLGLTATGVRQHLTILEHEGYVTSYEQRGKVGRPALRYALTTRGDALFPKQYDDLAKALLDEVRSTFGSDGLQRVVRGAANRLASPYPRALDGDATPEVRVAAAAERLRSPGRIA